MALTKKFFPNRSGSYQFVSKSYGNYQLPTLPGLEMIGNLFYVHNSGSATTGPNTPEDPIATIDTAVGLCTANNNDVVVVLPGHAETISAANGADLDVAGISVIGLGRGTNKPTLTFSAAGSTLRFNAANILLQGINFTSSVDSLTKYIDVNANWCTIRNCWFDGPAAKEFLSGINIATTVGDFTTIDGCLFTQGADPTGTDAAADTGAIFLVDSENVTISNCKFLGNFETACIHNRTTGAAQLWIYDSTGYCSLSGSEPIQLVSTATGGMVRCSFTTPAETAVTEATLSGTFPALFFNFDSYFGNDGSGGQTGVRSTSDAS